MTVAEVTTKRGEAPVDREVSPPPPPESRAVAKRRASVVPFLITLGTVVLAGFLGWALWRVYMGSPWTRDATVRALVVTMAPEVAGRIVELPVVDNQYVHKGDLLMVIEPTNYTIAVSQAEAAVQQAQASVQSVEAQMTVQQAQIGNNDAQLALAKAALVFAQQQAARYQDLAHTGYGSVQNAQQFVSQLHQQESSVQAAVEILNLAHRQVESLKAQRMSAEASLAQSRAQLHQAQVNLERTRILSPANGYVTNLLAHLGDFVNVGVNTISVVDAEFILGRRIFRGNEHRADPRGRRGQNHVDGLQRGCARTRRQHRPSHQCFECAARQPGRRYGQPDLHLGAPCPADPGPDPYR